MNKQEEEEETKRSQGVKQKVARNVAMLRSRNGAIVKLFSVVMVMLPTLS